jgi:ABC-type transporter MlaC component
MVQGVSFIASYRTQFDRVIRAESYSSLWERLLKKAMETTAAQR